MIESLENRNLLDGSIESKNSNVAWWGCYLMGVAAGIGGYSTGYVPHGPVAGATGLLAGEICKWLLIPGNEEDIAKKQ